MSDVPNQIWEHVAAQTLVSCIHNVVAVASEVGTLSPVQTVSVVLMENDNGDDEEDHDGQRRQVQRQDEASSHGVHLAGHQGKPMAECGGDQLDSDDDAYNPCLTARDGGDDGPVHFVQRDVGSEHAGGHRDPDQAGEDVQNILALFHVYTQDFKEARVAFLAGLPVLADQLEVVLPPVKRHQEGPSDCQTRPDDPPGVSGILCDVQEEEQHVAEQNEEEGGDGRHQEAVPLLGGALRDHLQERGEHGYAVQYRHVGHYVQVGHCHDGENRCTHSHQELKEQNLKKQNN